MSDQNSTRFRGLLIGETAKARLIRIADREVWVPRSVFTSFRKDGHPAIDGTVEVVASVENWFAEREGL